MMMMHTDGRGEDDTDDGVDDGGWWVEEERVKGRKKETAWPR